MLWFKFTCKCLNLSSIVNDSIPFHTHLLAIDKLINLSSSSATCVHTPFSCTNYHSAIVVVPHISVLKTPLVLTILSVDHYTIHIAGWSSLFLCAFYLFPSPWSSLSNANCRNSSSAPSDLHALPPFHPFSSYYEYYLPSNPPITSDSNHYRTLSQTTNRSSSPTYPLI